MMYDSVNTNSTNRLNSRTTPSSGEVIKEQTILSILFLLMLLNLSPLLYTFWWSNITERINLAWSQVTWYFLIWLIFTRENPHMAYLLVLSQDWITAAFLWEGGETDIAVPDKEPQSLLKCLIYQGMIVFYFMFYTKIFIITIISLTTVNQRLEHKHVKWHGQYYSLNIYPFVLFSSEVNHRKLQQLFSICKSHRSSVGLCRVGAGYIWQSRWAGLVSHRGWIYLVVFWEMLVYICGVLFECEGIFGLLILTDSSKDANHAGRTFVPFCWAHRNNSKGIEKTKNKYAHLLCW